MEYGIRKAATIKVPLREIVGIAEDIEGGVLTIVLEGERYPTTCGFGAVPLCILSEQDIVSALAKLRAESGSRGVFL